MATDDPRLNLLIKQGSEGQIVIVGCPFDFLRKRSLNKGGQDNGACCLRRFYPKVGPLVNAQYGVDITNLKVSDMGNIRIQISKQEEEQQFKNVATKRFKGQFVNYYKESPEIIIGKISENLVALVKNNQLPFVFGGSKEGLLGSVQAFHQIKENPKKNVYILCGRPFLQRPYDGDKATSDNISTILNLKYPNTNFTLFGPHLKYCPTQFLLNQNIKVGVRKQKLPNFNFITYHEIRQTIIEHSKRKLGSRTQALHKFIEIYNENQPSQVNISLQVLQIFTGCRDLSVQGLHFDELTQIMMFLGGQANLNIISINQFNPSCEDYQSSLLILNALYYFLLGRSKIKSK